jgi:predicted nucleic-acid-binding protein
VIGLDTNLLIRALVRGQGSEGSRARELIKRARTAAAPAFVNHVVLCEAMWVLARTYRYSRAEIAESMATILGTPEFSVAERPSVEEAFDLFQRSRADFADCLIGVLNRRAGCATTYTFDRRAAETADFSPVR